MPRYLYVCDCGNRLVVARKVDDRARPEPCDCGLDATFEPFASDEDGNAGAPIVRGRGMTPKHHRHER